MSFYTPNTLQDLSYHNHPLHRSSQGHLTPILDRIETMLDYACYCHNKILFMRMDVRFPQDEQSVSPQQVFPLDNTLFERFIAYFTSQLRHQGLDAHYLWVREQAHGEAQQHYHCVFLLDGNRTQNIYGHMILAKRIWGNILGIPDADALIDHCDRDRPGMLRNGVMLRRDDPNFQAFYNECFRWASYLAKADTKGMVSPNVNEFSSSRIPSPSTWRFQPTGCLPGLREALVTNA